MFNEFKFSETTKAQIAGRIEQVNLSGTMPAFIPPTFDVAADPASIGPATPRRPALHAEERQRRPDPEPALESRRQRHGAICRARAEACRAVLARRARRHRDVRHRQSRICKIETAKSVEVGLRRAVGPFRFEATAYYTQLRRLHLPAADRQHLRRGACVAAGDPATARTQPGALLAARRDLPRRRVPVPVRCRAAVDRLVGHRRPVRHRARDLHRRHQRAAHSADALGGGVYLARRQLARARQPAARLRAERHRAVGETPTPGYNELRAEVSYTRKLDDDRLRHQSEVMVGIVGNNLLNEHIRNTRVLHQGRGADAGRQCARVRDGEVLNAPLTRVRSSPLVIAGL